jgi:hypothetical protein
MDNSLLRIGEVFRYNKTSEVLTPEIDGYRNFINVTHLEGHNKALLESGINQIAKVNAPEGARTPCILISSSPHKIGSYEKPWSDVFDPDNGFIKYYGDNKSPKTDAYRAGNKFLIAAFEKHGLHLGELEK